MNLVQKRLYLLALVITFKAHNYFQNHTTNHLNVNWTSQFIQSYDIGQNMNCRCLTTCKCCRIRSLITDNRLNFLFSKVY